MDLNAMIAQGTQFKVPDLLGQAAQIQQLQQGAQSNQLNQMKMQEVQRGLQEQEGLRNYLRSGADLTAPGARLEFLKHGQTGLAYGKSLDEAKKAELEREKIGTDLIDARLKQSRLMLEGVSTPEDYLRWHEANHTDPVLGKYLASRGVTAETSRARIMQALNTPGGFEQMLNQSKLGAEKAMEQHFIESSSGRQKWTSTVPKYGAGVTPAQIIPGTIVNQVTTPGEQLQAETTRRGQDITARGQDITASTAAAALGQAGDPVIQGGLAKARATGEALGKDEVVAKIALPKIIEDATLGIQSIDALVGSAKIDGKSGKITFAKGGPGPARGFESVGGILTPLLKWVPGTSAADFAARHDQITGTAFLKAYETLRGGGAITEVEGAKGTAAISRMSMAQSPAEYVKAVKELQEVMKRGVQRAQERVKGPTANPIDLLLEKYK